MMSGFIWSLLIGAIAGWIAGQLTRGHGFGIVTNIILGIVGAFVGNFTLSLLGIAAYGMLGQLIASVVGAMIILWAARLISPGKAKS
ncbi:hypothetical protein SDC9_05902 [bioreactor metagenome]|uniref:Transglycosylase associated protein n=1 Tax=bioreactor metagenome TaxID=1076179 RepID=A0A644T0B4_9ZZZZ|nr:GlsB/YeaQ/YmgE family stress response membrane protein [Negativicutes bacterium]